MMDNILFIIMLFLLVVMILRGTCGLLKSPAIFKINRRENSCAKETKYFWQQQYKIKNICKLLDIRKVVGKYPVIYLQLRSGKNIPLFEIHQGPSDEENYADFDLKLDEITHFLGSNDPEYITEDSVYTEPKSEIVRVILMMFVMLFGMFFLVFYG